MYTVNQSISVQNGVCVAAGGPALPCNPSQQPALFVPNGPPYLPAAAAPTHHSLTSIRLLPLLLWISPFSFFLLFLCLYDLHTVHLTEFQPLWVSSVRIAGNVVEAKYKMADHPSKHTEAPDPAETPALSGLTASFPLAGCRVIHEIQCSFKSKNIYMHKILNMPLFWHFKISCSTFLDFLTCLAQHLSVLQIYKIRCNSLQ